MRAAGLLALATVPALALAHEPIFGVGPHTLFEGGVAAEVEVEFGEDGLTNAYELAYGITPDLTVTASVPLVFRSEASQGRFGLGDAAVRMKWRFLRLDSLGASDAVAFVAGLKLPTGAATGEVPLGSGSEDLLAALTYGHEGRRWYWWADVRYLLTTPAGSLDRGDVFFYDAAFGVRPWLLEYDEPDLVVLAEVNGRHIGVATRDGRVVPDSGADVVTAGPAIFFTYRNYALKAGISFPLWWSRGGTQAPEIEGVVAFEGHF